MNLLLKILLTALFIWGVGVVGAWDYDEEIRAGKITRHEIPNIK
jgi:hypothetical protein